MKVIDAENVNSALHKGLEYLLENGLKEESRNGAVLVAPNPVCTVYNRPLQRVLFSKTRDANPFFHLMESLWMLAGRNDLEFPEIFNSKFGAYSDNGRIINGAYGFRWRKQFGYDQLEYIIRDLKKNPADRRQVLAMWDGTEDLGSKSVDVPCNTHAYFRINSGRLDMTVCNRSNDVIWGAYGANAVHFSFLQEYLAGMVGVEVGRYYQISNNYHAYTSVYSEEKLREISKESAISNLYSTQPNMSGVPLFNSDHDDFMTKLNNFLDTGRSRKSNDFFGLVAEPLYQAWIVRKNGRPENSLSYINYMPMCDWREAAEQWLLRRKK